ALRIANHAPDVIDRWDKRLRESMSFENASNTFLNAKIVIDQMREKHPMTHLQVTAITSQAAFESILAHPIIFAYETVKGLTLWPVVDIVGLPYVLDALFSQGTLFWVRIDVVKHGTPGRIVEFRPEQADTPAPYLQERIKFGEGLGLIALRVL